MTPASLRRPPQSSVANCQRAFRTTTAPSWHDGSCLPPGLPRPTATTVYRRPTVPTASAARWCGRRLHTGDGRECRPTSRRQCPLLYAKVLRGSGRCRPSLPAGGGRCLIGQYRRAAVPAVAATLIPRHVPSRGRCCHLCGRGRAHATARPRRLPRPPGGAHRPTTRQSRGALAVSAVLLLATSPPHWLCSDGTYYHHLRYPHRWRSRNHRRRRSHQEPICMAETPWTLPGAPRQTPFVRHGSVSGDGCDSVRGGREGTRGIRLWQVTSVAAVLAGRPQRRLVKRRRLTTGSGGWSVRPAAPRVLVPEGSTTSRKRPRVACQPGTSGCSGGSGRNCAAAGARRVLRPHASATVGTDGGISAPLIIHVCQSHGAPPPPPPPTPHGGLRLTRAALPRNAATPRVDRRRATRRFPRRR